MSIERNQDSSIHLIIKNRMKNISKKDVARFIGWHYVSFEESNKKKSIYKCQGWWSGDSKKNLKHIDAFELNFKSPDTILKAYETLKSEYNIIISNSFVRISDKNNNNIVFIETNGESFINSFKKALFKLVKASYNY